MWVGGERALCGRDRLAVCDGPLSPKELATGARVATGTYIAYANVN